MNGKLTRIAMAKMLSQYAINVLWKEPDVSKWVVEFNDVTSKKDEDYDNGVTLAYQLGIMWQNMPWNNFRPNDEVSRAEFATALSRLLYSTSDGEYKSTSKYYIHHMEKLVNEWIITNDNPNMKELRWYVMIMLMRSAKWSYIPLIKRGIFLSFFVLYCHSERVIAKRRSQKSFEAKKHKANGFFVVIAFLLWMTHAIYLKIIFNVSEFYLLLKL
jgi:hypothetical protein